VHYSSFKNLKTTFEKSTFWNPAGLLCNKNKEQTVLTKTEKQSIRHSRSRKQYKYSKVESILRTVQSIRFTNDVTKSMSILLKNALSIISQTYPDWVQHQSETGLMPLMNDPRAFP
jgi:hypothetical protein